MEYGLLGENLSHMLKYDSVHGRFAGEIKHEENALITIANDILTIFCKSAYYIMCVFNAQLFKEGEKKYEHMSTL